MPSIRDDRGFNQGYKPSKSVEVRTLRRAQYMAERINKSGSSVLEIGCGTGQLSYMLAGMTGLKVTGADLCAPFIMQAKKTYRAENLNYVTADFNKPADIKKLRKAGGFDHVVGNGILHHLYYNLDASLRNIFLMLKKGGSMVFQEPNFYNPYCLLIFNIPVFRKMARLEPGEMSFTRRFIGQKLRDAGFTSVKVEYRDFLVPGVADFMIAPSIALGDIAEKIPVLNMLAQSLYIYAEK